MSIQVFNEKMIWNIKHQVLCRDLLCRGTTIPQIRAANKFKQVTEKVGGNTLYRLKISGDRIQEHTSTGGISTRYTTHAPQPHASKSLDAIW